MQIRIGDQVRFISEKTEGKVTGIVNDTTVNVYCDEYGFEIPASVHDLVVISSDSNSYREGKAKQEVTREKTQSPEAEASEAVYIAIVPENLNNLTESRYEIYLINDTSQTALYSVYFGNGEKYKGISAGNCNSRNTLSLGTFKLKDIDNDIKYIQAQLLFFSKETTNVPPVIDSHIKTNPVNICKTGSYKQTPWFTSLAMLLPLKEEKKAEKPIVIEQQDLNKILKEKNDLPKAVEQVEKRTGSNVIEVDLHINQLLETTAGMDNKDMLEYQMDTFRKTLDTYKMRKGQKIVFIHGKGDGVLRQRILWELQTIYKRFNHQDASFKQYGYGATMVTIK
ncbi:DUF2027 domain-containing protein [Odoribacter sp. OttesenSCG-928-A06]|nr:DUF2027 domain-containing protein [Odoribacter sp. OttesenSCG-928-A06]